MSQKYFQIFRSKISDLRSENVDYLKKPPWKKFFFDIFAIHSSSRYEKRCQMLQRLFSLFQGSKNQLCLWFTSHLKNCEKCLLYFIIKKLKFCKIEKVDTLIMLFSAWDRSCDSTAKWHVEDHLVLLKTQTGIFCWKQVAGFGTSPAAHHWRTMVYVV